LTGNLRIQFGNKWGVLSKKDYCTKYWDGNRTHFSFYTSKNNFITVMILVDVVKGKGYPWA
jgi:predicted membrane-bound dolichyl-phosphate-mannose-protein mannosyltransferase